MRVRTPNACSNFAVNLRAPTCSPPMEYATLTICYTCGNWVWLVRYWPAHCTTAALVPRKSRHLPDRPLVNPHAAPYRAHHTSGQIIKILSPSGESVTRLWKICALSKASLIPAQSKDIGQLGTFHDAIRIRCVVRRINWFLRHSPPLSDHPATLDIVMGPRLRVATNNVNWVGNMPLGFMISSYSCVTALEALRKLNTVQVCPISRHCLRPHLVFCFAMLRVLTHFTALSMLSCKKTRKVKPTLTCSPS